MISRLTSILIGLSLLQSTIVAGLIVRGDSKNSLSSYDQQKLGSWIQHHKQFSPSKALARFGPISPYQFDRRSGKVSGAKQAAAFEGAPQKEMRVITANDWPPPEAVEQQERVMFEKAPPSEPELKMSMEFTPPDERELETPQRPEPKEVPQLPVAHLSDPPGAIPSAPDARQPAATEPLFSIANEVPERVRDLIPMPHENRRAAKL